MKTLSIVLLAIVLSGCYSAGNRSPSNQQSSTSSDSKSTQTIEWTEAGMAFTLLPGWRLDDSDDNQRVFRGPDNSRFSVYVTTHTPEAGSLSVENETEDFYKSHESAGEEDLRYLEVDKIKGVHYLRDEKGRDENQQPQDQKHIVWNAQRMHKDTRQVISVSLSAPSRNWNQHREMLYQLLQSIRFT